jgi:hypothetical protein
MAKEPMKQVALSDFLTDKEIQQAIRLKTAKEIESKIISPNIDRINKALKQEHDPRYLAYAVSFAISQVKL